MATVLLDNGSSTLKIGLVDEPARLYPNFGLRVMDSGIPLYGSYLSELPIIVKAYELPVCVRGEICAWDLEEAIWRDALQRLYRDPQCGLSSRLSSFDPDCSEIDLVTTTSVDAHSAAKHQLLEYCFETMQFASVTVHPPQSYVLRLRPLNAATTGVVLDLGYSGLSATAHLYNSPITHSHVSVECGGAMLDDAFTSLVGETCTSRVFAGLKKRRLLIEPLRRHFFSAPENSLLEVAFDKNRHSYTVQTVTDQSLVNEEGRSVLGIRNSASVLHSLIDKVTMAVPNLINACIQSLPEELQTLVRQNIFICGGLANVKMLVDVLKEALHAGNVATVDNIHALPDPQLAAYNGMQVYAGSMEYVRSKLTRELYEEYGPSGLKNN